jgi:hypothetical protein
MLMLNADKLGLPEYTKKNNQSFLYHEAGQITEVVGREDGTTSLTIEGNHSIDLSKLESEHYTPEVGDYLVQAFDDAESKLGDGYIVRGAVFADQYAPVA